MLALKDASGVERIRIRIHLFVSRGFLKRVIFFASPISYIMQSISLNSFSYNLKSPIH